ncbi:MAG: InlB B-repeat-containing protein [Eubacteriales bacterium]|nr:InlB B-repeat-containing protein [Eubacteriales bacterium]
MNKDGSLWPSSGKTVTLSTSDTDVAGEGYQTVSDNAGGVYTFSALSPLVTYYVWMDGNYTGQIVTPSEKDATLDYYTVALTSGANITSVSGGGVYLKGTEITAAATLQTGDYVFSRWQNTASGALVSASNSYTFSVNSAVSLTAVSGATKYTAAVTLKKDGVDWSTSPRSIVLSTSESELAGTVTGTVSGNTYTFANLPSTGTYFVWDAQTVTYTGKQISSTAASAELEYFTVTVTPGSSVTAVFGAGTYLKGNSVIVTATPADYYQITGAGWMDGKFTINNISAAQTINPAAQLDTYPGTVTIKKDGVVWNESGKTITLSSSSTSNDALALTGLDPTKTYYIWAADAFTGQVLSRAAASAVVDYYTVSVNGNNATVTGGGVYLAGSTVTLAASNVTDGYDFVGWYSGSTLLSTGMTFTVSNLSSSQTLTAEASGTFDATVNLAGATGRDIKLSTSDSGLAGTVAGAGSGPCTFSGLTRGSTYYVFDNGTYTGKSVTKNVPNVTLQYYTVFLDAATGIDSVSSDGTYLDGSTVTVSASADSSHVFSGWSDGSPQNPYTITNLNSNKSLTANAALSFTGEVNLANGSILIENDGGTGKIRIMQNGTLLIGGDNLDPKTNIIIKGTYSGVNGISITATYGAYITLKDVSISGSTALKGCVDIADTAGNVTINLEGSNTLTGGDRRAGIYKGMGSNTLTITGSGSLIAEGGAVSLAGAAGIGATCGDVYTERNGGNNIIITGGNITANGKDGSAGIGGATYGNSGNITISGGTIIANGYNGGAGIGAGDGGVNSSGSGSVSITGGTITATSYKNQWGRSGAGIGGGSRLNSGSVTITGGTIIATSDGVGAGIGGGGGSDSYQPGNSGSITITGGTITATSNGGAGIGAGSRNSAGDGAGTTGTITITGGNIKTSSNGVTPSMGIVPVASNGKSLTLEENPWSGTSIVDNRGITYGMNGVQAIDAKIYAYVDRNGYYTITTPASDTQNGVTATASIPSNSGISANNTINVTITFSGTAQKPGTYTVGLTGTGIGTVVAQILAVGKDENVSESKTFSFLTPASNVTDLAINLSFSEAAKHTVSYYNGLTLIGSAAHYAGESYTLMDGSALNKIGYTFGGWGVSGNQTMGTSDVSRTAVWTPNTYKVVFHNDGSSTEQSFTYNAAAAALNGSITKTGYTLSGWAETLNGPKAYSVNATVQNLTSTMDGTVDLYAVWQAEDCSVSFANGGGAGEMAPQSFIHGVAQELPTNSFTRSGYTFTGWTDGATTYVNGQSIIATGNITLTAEWEANSYRVVFSGNGANGGTTMASQSFSYAAAPQNLTTNTFTRGGYTFAGWAVSSNGSKLYNNQEVVQNLTAAQNGTVTLYAVWTANTYTVTFNAGTGGTGAMGSQDHTYGAAKILTPNAFTRAGYSFSGWNTLSDGSGLNYEDKASVINLAMTGSVTLYAQWTADTYSLAFHSSNGVGSMDKQNFATGDAGIVSANRFVKPGYTFDGWKTKADASGSNYAANASLMSLNNLTDENPALYAKWIVNNYTVAFNSSGSTESMGEQSFTYDVSEALADNGFTHGSDTFLGWSASSTAETATYANKQSVSNLTAMANGKVTLYAVWRANTYEVRFDANGGSGDMLSQTIGRSVATALKTNAYTRSGYTFSGWNTSINGSGIRYTDGYEATNLPGDTASSITLYAQWTENARHNLNGTVKESGGALLSGATVKLMQGNTIVAQTMTGAGGVYFFGNLKSGSYNVVASKDGKTVTALVMITANAIQDMVIPAAATNNSILVVTNDPDAETLALTVGGLDDLAFIESADITMTITTKDEDTADVEQNAIKEKSGSQVVGIYLDMNVKKGVDKQTSTANVLEIVFPFSFSGKTDINVYRYHGGQSIALTKLAAKAAAPFTDGTYYLDLTNEQIYVYASQFSTYAVTYTGLSGGGGGGGGGTSVLPVAIDTVDSSLPFVDVPETHWAREAIAWASENGLFSGTSATTFGPAISTTRGMVVSVLWRMEKEPLVTKDNMFADVLADAYYGKAVDWANENGVVEGYGNDLFGPNDTITREQMAAILYRYAEFKGYDVSKRMKLDSFTDGSKTTGYAQPAMEWAVANNLISGKGNNILDPNGNATRAEVTIILMQFLELSV